MNAAKIQNTLIQIKQSMKEFAPYRKSELFSEFLVKGYTAITLSSVPKEAFTELLRAKVCLGSLITLYDDFADRPTESNPQLLELLYQLGFGSPSSVRSLNIYDRRVIDFASSLFAEIEGVLENLPHYKQFHSILRFDLAQFYTANQFGSLLTANPYINNSLENRLYTHHNMGMVLVSMMDIMATKQINFSEMGAMREIFLMGQRMGRIFNVLTTRKRETLDGDITGELSAYKSEHDVESAIALLRIEILELHSKIKALGGNISTFSASDYLDGLMLVQSLHEHMEGLI